MPGGMLSPAANPAIFACVAASAFAAASFIADMTSLEELWLASHSLEHLPPAICKLPKLRRLHLWYSNLSSVPEELFACTKLEELRITNNPMPDETVERLRKALPRTTIY